jgi:hypothetical protein
MHRLRRLAYVLLATAPAASAVSGQTRATILNAFQEQRIAQGRAPLSACSVQLVRDSAPRIEVAEDCSSPWDSAHVMTMSRVSTRRDSLEVHANDGEGWATETWIGEVGVAGGITFRLTDRHEWDRVVDRRGWGEDLFAQTVQALTRLFPGGFLVDPTYARAAIQGHDPEGALMVALPGSDPFLQRINLPEGVGWGDFFATLECLPQRDDPRVTHVAPKPSSCSGRGPPAIMIEPARPSSTAREWIVRAAAASASAGLEVFELRFDESLTFLGRRSVEGNEPPAGALALAPVHLRVVPRHGH